MDTTKIKKALEDIKKIIEKNDLAGVIVLHDSAPNPSGKSVDGDSQFFFKINPSYSAAQLIKHGKDTVLMVKGKKIHYMGGAKERDMKIASTQNMFHHLIATMGKVLVQLYACDKKINDVMGNPEMAD